LDPKITRAIGIRREYCEGMQAQRYDVGKQFNRSWTFMVYLNEGMEGGVTRFKAAGHAIVPKAGMALLWNDLHADGTPNTATMHCGEPVIRGHKLVITKWFRVLGTGPVFC
jgi:prolyl 4-hydroxylase